MSWAYGMLMQCCGFMEKIKKKYIEKNCCNPLCFQGKNYKAKFLTNLIFKKKINKENFGNNHKKKRKEKKPYSCNYQLAQY